MVPFSLLRSVSFLFLTHFEPNENKRIFWPYAMNWFAFVKGFLLGFLDLQWIVYRFLGFLRFFTTTKTSCWYDFWRSLFGNCTTGKFSFPLRIYLFIGITLSDYKIAQGVGFCNRECCINLTIPPCIKGRIYIIWIISPCIFGISMIW